MKLQKFPQETLLLGGILFLIALGCVIAILLQPKSPQEYALVQRRGELLLTLPLDQDQELRLEDEQGFHLLCIQEGAIAVTDSSCPDLLCVQRGFQSGESGAIICLPLSFLIRFSQEEFDGVSG